MYVRNLLSAGDYLVPVPLGLPLTVQYDDAGMIRKVLVGYNDAAKRTPDSFQSKFIEMSVAPLKIGVTGGETWVTGVLYTNRQFTCTGSLPQCIQETILYDFVKDPNAYKFYAASVKSLGTLFTGAGPIRQWLNMSGFTTLPGALMPASITRKSFYQVINPKIFHMKYPVMIYYIIFRGKDILYYPIPLDQSICNKVTTKLNSTGAITGCIDCEGKSIEVPYTDIIKYDIQSKTLIISDSDNKIIKCEKTDSKVREPRDELVCSVCKRPIHSADDIIYRCDNPDCLSTKYSDLNYAFNILGLPSISFDDYITAAKSSKILNLADVLDLPFYETAQVTVSLSDLLNAVIPLTVTPVRSVIKTFVSNCRSTLETVIYYMNHPDKIYDDFNMKDVNSVKLINWFKNDSNVMNVMSFVEHPKITIDNDCKKFDGPKIFRNTYIAITGTFKHGDYSTIKSILESYGAEVFNTYVDGLNCVVVGDIPENVNGVLVQKAKQSAASIFSESMFFNQYMIDEDIQENLVSSYTDEV